MKIYLQNTENFAPSARKFHSKVHEKPGFWNNWLWNPPRNIANSEIWYQIFGGTRQGGIESPPSFVWYFDFVLKIMRNRINEEIGETGAKFDFNINHSLKAKRGSEEKDTKLNGSVWQ